MTESASHSSIGSLFRAYNQSQFLSIKYDTYFHVYERLLNGYRGKDIVLVEVGVFQGGSLFMWREFFGKKARIIGIDLNPAAREWEEYGFEIYIGDQGSESFWKEFFYKIGNIDVLIDDGGHTNRQQVITTHSAISNINDGGLLIVEDIHTNYFREFGNPSKYSFINFAYRIIDSVNSRSHAMRRVRKRYSDRVYSVHFYESMIAFEIDSSLCKQSMPTSNHGESRGLKDFRYQGRVKSALYLIKNRFYARGNLVGRIASRGIDTLLSLLSRLESIKYRCYFRDQNHQ